MCFVMQISFQPSELPGVYHTRLSQDISHFVTKLDHETNWQGQGGYGRWQIHSLYEHHTVDFELRTVLAWLRSDPIKQRLIDLAVKDAVFCDQWSCPDVESLDRLSESYSYFVRTPARFEDHPWHVDARNLMIQGMIYIVNDINREQGTWFCRDYRVLNDADGCDILKVPAEPAQGWALINSDRSFHRGLNYTEQDRYCIKFGLHLIMQSQAPA